MNIDRNAPVGVFDSGIGGLTVAREIMRNLPSEKLYILEIRREFPTEASPGRRSSAIPARSFISCRSRKSRPL